MITLLIPTLNRPRLLLKTLAYYESNNFLGEIIIGDSSSKENFLINQQNIKKFKLSIKIFHLPNLNNYGCTEFLIDHSNFEYCIWAPDDDFFYLPTVLKAIDFLNKNKDYSVAYGITKMFSSSKKNTNFKSYFINQQTSLNISFENPLKRLEFHINNYSPLFIGVCKKEHLKKALNGSMAISVPKSKSEIEWDISQQFSEIMVSLSLATLGKVKSFGALYWIRNIHDERYVFKDIDEIIFHEKTKNSLNFLVNKIYNLLIKRDNILQKKVKNLILEKIFFSFNRKKENVILKVLKYKFFSIKNFYSSFQFYKIRKFI